MGSLRHATCNPRFVMWSRERLERTAEIYGGVPVWGCLPGSPADRAGLRGGDILLSVNGRSTGSLGEFLTVREWKDGEMTLRVVRNGQELDLLLRREDWSPRAGADEVVAAGIALRRHPAPCASEPPN